MNPLSAHLTRLLTEAAELKAGGASWEQIAARLGRRPATCRRWSVRYAKEWQRLFRAAERQLLAEAGGESVLTLRQLLRSEDEKVRRDVARSLATLRERQRLSEDRASSAPTDDDRLTTYAENHDDVQSQALTEELQPLAADESTGAVADSGAAEPD